VAYAIEFTRAAQHQFESLPAGEQRTVRAKINQLAANPRPGWARALTGLWARHWRFRAGRYRIIYAVADTIQVVTIVKIGKRDDVYEVR
jgi:mRNA interferase RelE/StbE